MARRKTGDKKAVDKKDRAASEEVNNVQADDHSIAFKELHVGGDVGGDIRIGHTIGYTAEQVSVLLKQITTTFQPKPFDGRCPYKGLEVFEEEDAELFFGRERLVNELVGRVKESRTVFITGPSGSGKSSLVRAGLIHALKQGGIKSSDRWLYETMKPGREPIKDLALAFSRLKLPELGDYFLAHAGETEILNKCAESVLSGRKDQRFVLFVDQFEEVFTQINGEEERVAFINMLAHAGTIENGRVIVLFAMRSDFVSNCATYPALNELLSQEFRQIGAMQPEELVSAIALPARHVGLPIEDELIARIINDMKGEPGALPLMQFALKDLFDSQQEKGGVIALTLKDYLGHGGIHKSLERHADNTFSKFSESEQELTRSIFSGLIEIGRGTQDTKRTALFDELVPANTKPEDVGAIVQKLADARLIITDEQAGKDTVTISHEKLIEAWPWLRKLVNENRDAIALQNEIANDAKEWEEHKHDQSYLYTGARLANAREKLEAKRIVLSDLSQIFVHSSQEAGEAEQRQEEQRRQKEVEDARKLADAETKRAEIEKQRAEEQTRSATNLRRRSLYLTIALVAALIAVSAAVFFGFQSRQQTNVALARQLTAQAQAVFATGYTRQATAVLLAVESMNIFPTSDAAQVFQKNTLAFPIANINQGGPVTSIVFSPDGKYLASAGCDESELISYSCKGSARIWDVMTGKEISRITQDGIVSAVAFSPDGKYLVSGGCDISDVTGYSCFQGSAHVWDAMTGKEIARTTQDSIVSTVAFSPDGKYVGSGGCDASDLITYSCTQGIAHIWDAMTGTEIVRMTHINYVKSIIFSSDGKYAASASVDHTIRIWGMTSGVEIAQMNHNGGVNRIDFSTDGEYIVSGSDDKSVRVWQTITGNEITRMTHDDRVNTVAFSPDADGNYVISGSDDKTARVWETVTGNEVARTKHDNVVVSVVFSPNGKYVGSGGCDEISGSGPYGSYVCVLGTARVWEAETGKEVARTIHDNSVTAMVFNPDGKYVASGSYDNAVIIWEAYIVKEIVGYKSTITYSDCKDLWANDWAKENTISVQDVRTGAEIASITLESNILEVALSPDCKYVVSGSEDGSVYVWDATTGNEVSHMNHDGVTSVVFSPDGKYLMSDSIFDENTRIWEAMTGKELTLIPHGEFSFSAGFSPDGKYIVTERCDEISPRGGCIQTTARFWLYRPQDIISDACSRVTRNLTRAEWKQYIDDAMEYEAICPNLPIEPEPTTTVSP